MPEPSDDEIDRLLSRGELGREHKQRLLRSVLASVHAQEVPRPRRWPRWPALAALSLSGAVTLAVLWARPPQMAESVLREKGAPTDLPIIAMSCLGGSLAACPTGSRIAFWLEGPSGPGFVTAYADPVAGGERVWFLRNEALPRAALVDRGRASGRYRVNAVLTRRPIQRAELARLAPDAVITRATFDLVVGSR